MFNFQAWLREAAKSGLKLDRAAIQNAITSSGKSAFQATISVSDKMMLIAIPIK